MAQIGTQIFHVYTHSCPIQKEKWGSCFYEVNIKYSSQSDSLETGGIFPS